MATSNTRRWTADDISRLKELARTRPIAQIADQLVRSYSATAVKAHQLKLSLRLRPPTFNEPNFPGELTLVPAALTGRISGGLFIAIEVRPDIGPAIAARLTGKPGLEIREAHGIRPAVPADRRGMAALIVGAIDQQPAYAGCAHFREGDLSGRDRHAAIEARSCAARKSL